MTTFQLGSSGEPVDGEYGGGTVHGIRHDLASQSDIRLADRDREVR